MEKSKKKIDFFQVNEVFTSEYLRYKYGEKEGQKIPIRIVEVNPSINELLVDWGSGIGFDSWRLDHCRQGAAIGDYKHLPKLYLNVTADWFPMIEKGVKKEDYREIKDYWIRRLIYLTYHNKPLDEFTKGDYKPKYDWGSVVISNGFNKAPSVEFEFLGIEVKTPNPAWSPTKFWDKPFFAVKLGEKLTTY